MPSRGAHSRSVPHKEKFPPDEVGLRQRLDSSAQTRVSACPSSDKKKLSERASFVLSSGCFLRTFCVSPRVKDSRRRAGAESQAHGRRKIRRRPLVTFLARPQRFERGRLAALGWLASPSTAPPLAPKPLDISRGTPAGVECRSPPHAGSHLRRTLAAREFESPRTECCAWRRNLGRRFQRKLRSRRGIHRTAPAPRLPLHWKSAGRYE